MNRLTDDELIIRYANNYNIDKSLLTIDKILYHWELEKKLAQDLLKSSRKNRNEIFINAYNRLYSELPWLLKTGSSNINSTPELIFNKRWLPLFKTLEGKRIFEIGSGNGELIRFLAKKKALCVGTEITRERPNSDHLPNLNWHITDGVNLVDYEPLSCYDYVISDQVIEHLHPEDISLHFLNVYKILKTGGEYIFYTPNYYRGPGDVSLIFGTKEAQGMHLKEYKYYELYNLLKKAGFKKIYTVKSLQPDKIIIMSTILFKIFMGMEKLLIIIPDLILRKKVYNKVRLFFKIHNELVLICKK